MNYFIGALFIFIGSLGVNANPVAIALANPHKGDFLFCYSEVQSVGRSFLLTLDGEVYFSQSSEKNPSLIQDFVFLSNFNLLKPDEKEMFIFTINKKKYSVDFVRIVSGYDLAFALTYQDDDNFHSLGILVQGDKELPLVCYDVKEYQNQLSTK